MNLYLFLPSGKKLKAQGDFRGVQQFAPQVIGPIIELDLLDERGQRQFLIPDPRAYITDGVNALYNPRDYLRDLSNEMQKEMEVDITWPLRAIQKCPKSS